MQIAKANIIDYLVSHSLASPEKIVFTVLKNGEELQDEISYRELESRVKALGSMLAGKKLQGKRVLLFYQDILEFIISFLACQYSGIVPIPVSYVRGSKQFHKLINIIDDAQASAIFCTQYSVTSLQQAINNFPGKHRIKIITTSKAEECKSFSKAIYKEISFIQYTSGSTGLPKGVVISNKNLFHNQALLMSTFRCDKDSVILSWLPYHHDMGLIGNILHTLYTGCTCVLMSPVYFMQKPERWLEAISCYKATHSGGPNFAYDLCVSKISKIKLKDLNLSGWKVAYNGSEPVRFQTIQRFADYFKETGFNKNSFYPCYGLAEATLLVSGNKKNDSFPRTLFVEGERSDSIRPTENKKDGARAIVSCGKIADSIELKIISVHDQHECGELEAGEICICGDSITKGYWNKNNKNIFYETGGKKFLKTGDLGFIYDAELFINGRLKETLIIRGVNTYPYDIEQLVSGSHEAIETNGVALFSIDEMREKFVIVAEIKRTFLKDPDAVNIISAIDKLVTGSIGLSPYDIVLTGPLGIPRTTSGKLQRVKCCDSYRINEFNVIGSKLQLPVEPVFRQQDYSLAAAAIRNRDYNSIKKYLINIIEVKAGNWYYDRLPEDTELTDIGIDSLRAMELINTINKDLAINIDVSKMFRDNVLSGLIADVENMLWVQHTRLSGKEITI